MASDAKESLQKAVHEILGDKDSDEKASTKIAENMSKDNVTLEELTGYDDDDLKAYVNSWNFPVPIGAAFKAAIKSKRKQSDGMFFYFCFI